MGKAHGMLYVPGVRASNPRRARATSACGAALGVVLGLVGCSSSDPAPSASSAAAPAAQASALASADPAVLREIVARLPSALPPTSPSGTLVGADAGRAGAAAPIPIAPPSGAVADVALEAPTKLSSASTERALRASLYAELVLRCRAPDGSVLPPDAVTLEFRVRPDGQIDRGSATSTAASTEHAEAARCMLRVLKTSDVRIPASRGHTSLVRATVPSVD